MHLYISGNRVATCQLQRGATVEGQIIDAMPQRSILHPQRSAGTFMSRNATAIINSPIFHAQTSTVKIGLSIHSRSEGRPYFILCSGHIALHLIQIILRRLTCEKDISLLFDIFERFIQIECVTVSYIDRIPEFNTFTRCSRKGNCFSISTSIDTPEKVAPVVIRLCILIEKDRIVIADTQITGSINRATGGGSRISSEHNDSVVVQGNTSPINSTTGGR